jgi:sarcosine oxidase subunit beta
LQRYSILSLIRQARRGHAGWAPAWRKAEPRRRYDLVIVGGGAHALAIAYYLARRHGIRDVAVLGAGWLGGGNTARNTAIIRSNYRHAASMALYELSRSLYQDLSRELNFNVLFTPRGVLDLALTPAELAERVRTAEANRARGIDSWIVPPREAAALAPALEPDPGYCEILGALWQPRGGTADHDAVAWGYARAASARGVDIVENCAVHRLAVEGERVSGVETARGRIDAGCVVLAAAAGTPALAATAGVALPLTPTTLQAFVTEPVKPVLDVVVMATAVNVYVSQARRGEIVVGGRTDPGAGRGDPSVLEDTAAALVTLFPSFSRLRMMRAWAGTVDLTEDRSPILGRAGPDGLWLSCGWGTGGFKAVPGAGLALAAAIAGEPSPIVAPFALERFASGRLIDEHAASGVLQ